MSIADCGLFLALTRKLLKLKKLFNSPLRGWPQDIVKEGLIRKLLRNKGLH